MRNEAQNEFRKSLSDLSGLMWTIKEGTATVEALRRELTITEKTLENRISTLESGYANIQGRVWAVSALFALVSLALTFGSKFIVQH